MAQTNLAFLAFTALVGGGVVALLIFAALRLGAAVRPGRRQGRAEADASTFMTEALQDAVARLKEQERASQARAEASERLASEIIASMTAGLMVVGGREEVRTINPAGRRLLALEEAEPHRSFKDILGSRARPLAEAVTECLTTGRAVVRRTIELAGPNGNGEATHLGVTVSPIADTGSDPHGAICLFTDLTAIVELEEQLRLKESLARLGELTAGIAHEFRNGLATIHGYGKLIEPEQLPEPFRAYVLGIRQETQALAEMMANFLNFARPSELSVSCVDLRTLADRAAEEVRPEAWARGGSVQVRGEFARVDGDEVLLRQAFSNLCRNAFEACSEAGLPPLIAIEGSVHPDQGWAKITVSDHGPGIDPTGLDRVFRPFFTTRRKGTGLGLALVQKIVVTHGGRVAASNDASGGARFQVVLPLAPAR
jgi:nitrogen fixation/metabolism regulation signal transduction histidine kinase